MTRLFWLAFFLALGVLSVGTPMGVGFTLSALLLYFDIRFWHPKEAAAEKEYVWVYDPRDNCGCGHHLVRHDAGEHCYLCGCPGWKPIKMRRVEKQILED